MKQKMTPIELARQTLMQLSKNQSPPTPENFQRVYNEIAGIKTADISELISKSLEKVLNELGKHQPKYLVYAQKIPSLVKNQDASSFEQIFRKLIPAGTNEKDGVNWSNLLRYLLKQLDANHTGVTLSRKKEGVNRVIINFSNDPSQLGHKIQALITSWGEGQPTAYNIDTKPFLEHTEDNVEDITQSTEITLIHEEQNVEESQVELALVWRDLLIRTISLVVLPQFIKIPAAAERIEALIKRAEECKSVEEVNQLNEALKSTLLRAEMQNDSQQRMQESLVEMLRLLVSSMGELTIEDKWLHGQIEIIQEIISKPLNIDAIYNAENSLKDLIMKQSSIKPGLVEAQDTLKIMIRTFINGLTDIAASTESYQAKISDYQDKITTTEDMTQLNEILQNLVGDIRAMNHEAMQSHNTFEETQKKVEDAEKKINELTAKLDYISEVAHEDFLTGALNRRGMDEAIEREFNRADRHNTPISIAMIDIDHFKKINDTMGHSTGDVALAHLAKVVKSVLRSTDVLARYGGEEFVILLPGSKQSDAVNVVTGVQRDLTKNFFMHKNERVLITFSAGVAERVTGEIVDSVLPRADSALYLAKQTGRNRVIGAITPNINDLIIKGLNKIAGQ